MAKAGLLRFGAAILVLLVSCGEDDVATPVSADVAITNAFILDGWGGDRAVFGTVLIESETIEAVLPRNAGRFRAARTIDAAGGYLLPGFIDAHAHILVPRCQSFAADEVVFDRALSEEVASALLDFGVTTVRSPATPTVEGLALRDDLNAGRVRAPQARASAELINDRGMSENELRRYVRDAMPFGPDYFKVYASLSAEQIAVVVEEAHGHGVPVIGHLGRVSWREGAALGIDYLTHAADWSEESLPQGDREAYRAARKERGPMRARLDWLERLDLQSDEVSTMIDGLVSANIAIDPTLVAFDSKFSSPSYPRYRANPHVDIVPELSADWRACRSLAADWSEDDFARWRQLFPKLQALVKLMHDRGVTMMTGSDTTNEWVIPGESLHQEFELLVEAGLSPSQVLHLTGAGAARALRLDDRGTIEAGRRADLVLLEEDPLLDISRTRSIAWVMQGGAIVAPRPVADRP